MDGGELRMDQELNRGNGLKNVLTGLRNRPVGARTSVLDRGIDR